MVCIFNPACELLPPWKKELQYTCVLLPLYCTFSLTSSVLPPSQCTVYLGSVVTVGGGGGCWNVLWTIFSRSFTLCFWPDSEPTKLLHHPKQKLPVPEFIDPVFTKTSPKRSFSLNRKRAFWLVFVKTGSIISGTVKTTLRDWCL